MKKIKALILTLVMLMTSFLPAFSIKAPEDIKTDYINLNWWENFSDPILNNYIMKAVNYNHNLKIAKISTKEYYEYVKLQFAGELPTVSGGFAPAYVKMPNTTSSSFQFALPLIANYEIDLFLKNRDKTKSVKKNYEMALEDERAAYIAVASAVGTTYLNIVNLDETIKLQEEIIEQRNLIYNLMQKRHIEGITSTQDLIRTDKSRLIAKTELSDLKKQREKLLHSFCVLIGETPDNKDNIKRISFNELNFRGNIPNEIKTDVIEKRPDYIKAAKNVEKAGIDVRIAKKEFLPTFNIGGLALFNAGDLGSLLTTKNMLNAIGGSIGADIFKGGAKFANLRLNKHVYERRLEEYLQTNLTSIQEVNDSLVSIKRDREKLETIKKQENFEEKDYNFYMKRYNQGVVSKLDLAQAKENLLVVNKLKTIGVTDCYVDYISLYKAAGTNL